MESARDQVPSRPQILESIAQAILSLDLDRVRNLCTEALGQCVPAYNIIVEGMGRGLDLVGRRFQTGEYFLSELVAAGEIMKQVISSLEPRLEEVASLPRGTIVVGTVQGDLHDIGKNIFAILARSAGFDVIDLGVDVPVEKFVETTRAGRAKVVGISALLTTTMLNMANVARALRTAGLRQGVRIIVGGAAVSDGFGKRIGADAAVNDAVIGLDLVKEWIPARPS